VGFSTQQEIRSMRKSSNGSGPKPEGRSERSSPQIPAEMIESYKRRRLEARREGLGRMIAGTDAAELERLMANPVEFAGALAAASAAFAASLVAESYAAGNEPFGDQSDRPLNLVEVARLVDLSVDEVDAAVEAGRFPLPDGYISGRAYWDRDTIGWWVKRGKSL
jgi:hypothetical protein